MGDTEAKRAKDMEERTEEAQGRRCKVNLDNMPDEVKKDFESKLLALVTKADAFRSKGRVYPLPLKARAAIERIDNNMHCSTPMTLVALISDLGYFIGYMEALTDPKGGK